AEQRQPRPELRGYLLPAAVARRLEPSSIERALIVGVCHQAPELAKLMAGQSRRRPQLGLCKLLQEREESSWNTIGDCGPRHTRDGRAGSQGDRHERRGDTIQTRVSSGSLSARLRKPWLWASDAPRRVVLDRGGVSPSSQTASSLMPFSPVHRTCARGL